MTQPPLGTKRTRPGHPLVRALTVSLTIVLIVVVYAFAFDKTEVDLEEVKSPERQDALVRIIRGLSRPDLIEFAEVEAFHEV